MADSGITAMPIEQARTPREFGIDQPPVGGTVDVTLMGQSAGSLSKAAQARMIAVLTLFAMLASIDKNFLTLVVASVRTDLGISDTQMGLLIGMAFAISNVAIAVPAGWLADRIDRRRIVAGAVGLCSLMAGLCGAAASFSVLFAARIGVGLGEGLSPPAAYSLLRDGVPQHRHGRAFGVFSIGSSVGAGLSFILAGGLLAFVSEFRIDHLPLVGEVRPWQASLILIGLAGLPLSLLAFGFPEPGRANVPAQGAIGYPETLRLMASRRSVMLPLMIYSVALATLTSGWAAWAPAIIERSLRLTPQQVGPVLGAILMVGAPIGLVGAGQLMDRVTGQGAAIVAIVSGVAMTVATAFAPHAKSLGVFLAPQTLITLTSMMFLPVVSTVVARTMPGAAIGKTMAVFLLFQGVVGAGLGPLIVAFISDRIFAGDPFAMNRSITIVAVGFGALATIGAAGLIARPSGSKQLPKQE